MYVCMEFDTRSSMYMYAHNFRCLCTWSSTWTWGWTRTGTFRLPAKAKDKQRPGNKSSDFLGIFLFATSRFLDNSQILFPWASQATTWGSLEGQWSGRWVQEPWLGGLVAESFKYNHYHLPVGLQSTIMVTSWLLIYILWELIVSNSN
jgi:hypothetical protein